VLRKTVTRSRVCFSAPCCPAAMSPSPAALGLPASPTATRHQECVIRQPIPEVRTQNLLHFSTGLGNDSNPCRRQCRLQRAGNGAADEDLYAQARKLADPPKRAALQERGFRPADLASFRNIRNEQTPCHIEYRRDSALPMRNRHSHAGACFTPHATPCDVALSALKPLGSCHLGRWHEQRHGALNNASCTNSLGRSLHSEIP
jgi:hypothetical protein